MNVDVTMPQLGETVAEGTITRWLRQVGDVVADQEPLLEITTDKVDTEVPAPAAGRLLRIVAPENETVSVGTVIAVIAADTGDATGPVGDAPAPLRPTEPSARVQPADPSPAHRPRHVHSPRVRRLAAEAGVDLGAVAGTGPGGRVTPADVLAASPRPVRPEPDQRSGAGLLPRTTVVEVDVTDEARREVGSALAPVVRAALAAVRDFPQFGAGRDVAVNVDQDGRTRRRLIRDAADLNLPALADRLADCLAGEGDDATGNATFGVAHSGRYGALMDTPPVLPGQYAVLDVGAVVERAAVVRYPGDVAAIAVRSFVHLSLTYDPRRIDGPTAAGFLARVGRAIASARSGHGGSDVSR